LEITSLGSNVPALINLGIKVVEVSGIKKQVIKHITGKKILVSGMTGAGKTTLTNYIQYGIFSDESKPARTIDPEESPTFSITVGSRGMLDLNVKTVIEIPGQYYPEEHARAAYKHNPQSLLLFVDSTRVDDAYQWVETFCSSFEREWLGGVNETIQSIVVVINKRDKVDADFVDFWQPKFKKLVVEKLNCARGRLDDNYINAMPCVLISNPEQTKYVDAIVTKVALDLKK
jgi:signal recognition particle receptor subunit beta